MPLGVKEEEADGGVDDGVVDVVDEIGDEVDEVDEYDVGKNDVEKVVHEEEEEGVNEVDVGSGGFSPAHGTKQASWDATCWIPVTSTSPAAR